MESVQEPTITYTLFKDQMAQWAIQAAPVIRWRTQKNQEAERNQLWTNAMQAEFPRKPAEIQ